MKFYYLSDIHINHHVQFTNHSEKWERATKAFVTECFVAKDSKSSTIILAGDFSEWNVQTKWVFEELSLHYKYVVGVVGNHDLYLLSKKQVGKYKRNSMNRIKELMEMLSGFKNVHLLQNETVTLDGVTIAGTRLWYTLTTPESKAFFSEMSNDSNYIFPNHNEFYEDYNQEDLVFYNSLSNVDLMVTHVPPIHPKTSPYPYSECYTTKIDELKSTRWVCGHQHVKCQEQVLDTTFYMNPMGYPNESSFTDFNLESFEI